MKMKKKNTIIILTVFIVLLVLSLLAIELTSPDGLPDKKEITIKIDHLSGSDTEYSITTNSQYLRGALDENNLVSGQEAQYGLWVQSVDGETADESMNQWWGYSINGENAMYGVDQQIISNGDIIEFKLNEGY